MPVQTGDKLTPGRLNVQVKATASTAALTLTTTLTDVPGTNMTFTVPYPGATWVATWAGDFELTGAASIISILGLAVDGVSLNPPQAVWNPSNVSAGARETEGQSATGVFAAAGTHTFKLQASRNSGTGGVRLNPSHTTLTVVIYP